ncbi:MAG TPA: hypothetical protein VHZ73_06785, partial [Vicinamibacterales bacterium]|nr:hypothetical protein [Vicinamibacterales bacterium]
MTETAFAPKLRRLGSETLIYGLSAVLARFLNYFLQPYYAHQLPLSQNGVQGVVYGYVPFIYAVLYLGMDVAYMRNTAAAAPLEERQRAFTMSAGTVAAVGGVLSALA